VYDLGTALCFPELSANVSLLSILDSIQGNGRLVNIGLKMETCD
jgi:hypothetical protein